MWGGRETRKTETLWRVRKEWGREGVGVESREGEGRESGDDGVGTTGSWDRG